MSPTSPGTQGLVGPADAFPRPAGPCCRLGFVLLGSNAWHKLSPPPSSLSRAGKEGETRRANLCYSAAKPWGKNLPPPGSSRERAPRETHRGSFPGCCKRCADTAIMLLGKGLNRPPPSPKTTPGLVVPILPALHSTRPRQGCCWVLLCLEPDGVFPRFWEEWETVEAG